MDDVSVRTRLVMVDLISVVVLELAACSMPPNRTLVLSAFASKPVPVHVAS